MENFLKIRPPLEKILDPPLIFTNKFFSFVNQCHNVFISNVTNVSNNY